MSAGDDDSPYNDYIEDPSQSKKGEKTFVVISDHPSPRVSNVLKNNSNNDDSPTLAVSSASVSTGNRDTNADENNNTNSAAEISELADEEDEDMAFVNSLNDDVEEGEKFDMIAEVAKIGGKLWAEFSQEELKMLSKVRKYMFCA